MKKQRAILIPSILAMGFIPLISHLYTYDTDFGNFVWYSSDILSETDLFLFWKMVAIILVGIVMTGILFYQRYIRKTPMQFEKSFYLMLIYMVFVVLTTLLSPYKRWTTLGSMDRFEPYLVLLAYMVFCYYTYQYVHTRQQVKTLLGWSSIGMLIIILIGLSQFLGQDFLDTKIGRMLLLNPSQWKNADTLQFYTSHMAYSTLYNPNYLSFYFGIAIPLLLCLIIGVKKKTAKIVLSVVEILAIICLIGAKSASGWLALGATFVILVLILCSRRKKWFFSCLTVFVLLFILGTVLCLVTPLRTTVLSSLIGTGKQEDCFSLQAIDTRDDEVVLTIWDHELHIDYDYTEETNTFVLHCTDENGEILSYSLADESSNTLILTDPAYLDCSITPVNFGSLFAIEVDLDGCEWNFTKNSDGTFYYINSAMKLEKYTSTPVCEIFNDDMMSGRGHIWNMTIPLLKNYLLFGAGANCFTIVYPQNDYLYRAWQNCPNLYDVKPHSWYLQQWVETGLIGFLALFGFYLCYFVRCVKIYRKIDLHDSFSWVGIGIFSGTLAYMITGFANDSLVCTAPPFWILLGLGMAVNRMIEEKACESVTSDTVLSKTETEASAQE